MPTDPLFLILVLGFVLQFVGFVFRDEFWLRLLVALGFACSAFVAWSYSEPSFDPGMTAPTLLIVNLVMLGLIFRERSTLGMSKRDQRLFEALKTVTPGQFRRINRLAEWRFADTDKVIIVEDQPGSHLTWIDARSFGLEKAGHTSDIDGPSFVGEVGFLHKSPASATVTVRAGTIYAEWDNEALRALMAGDTALSNALVARFSYDLARRVALSVPLGANARAD